MLRTADNTDALGRLFNCACTSRCYTKQQAFPTSEPAAINHYQRSAHGDNRSCKSARSALHMAEHVLVFTVQPDQRKYRHMHCTTILTTPSSCMSAAW